MSTRPNTPIIFNRERAARQLDARFDELLEKLRRSRPGEDPWLVRRAYEIAAEHHRKMILAMVNDVRVVLIKLADRLHNMRTLEYVEPEKQQRIARETLDLYAPIAHRLGMSLFRNELEDLSFRYLDPDSFFALQKELADKTPAYQKFLEEVK